MYFAILVYFDFGYMWYPLRGYILGVLTHTTALDQLWGGDETLNTYLSFALARVF